MNGPSTDSEELSEAPRIDLDHDHHDAHLNEEKAGFDPCFPVLVHCRSEEEARRVAKILTAAYKNEEADDVNRFESVRLVLSNQPDNGVDWADLLDYIDHLEKNGYRGEFHPEPDARAEDVVFEAGLAAGYACGLLDGGTDE